MTEKRAAIATAVCQFLVACALLTGVVAALWGLRASRPRNEEDPFDPWMRATDKWRENRGKSWT